MKYLLIVVLCLGPVMLHAQKYVLLDKRISRPITTTNEVTSQDKFNGLFPVEKNKLKEFVNALEEIDKLLLANGKGRTAKQFEIGCIQFTGHVVANEKEERLDYVLNSTCDNVFISMHIADGKISNASNSYFIKTWIKYIESYSK
jgi:hypothetical protein